MKKQEDLPKDAINARNEIFITYANNLIIKDPENLRKLLKKIEEFGRCFEKIFPDIKDKKTEVNFDRSVSDLFPVDIKTAVNGLFNIIKIDNYDEVEPFRRGISRGDRIAFWAAYLFTEGCMPCRYNLMGEREKTCLEMYGTFKRSPQIKRHIRCYECDQAAFKTMLDRICKGESIEHLKHFTELLYFRNRYTTHIVYQHNGELRQIIAPTFIKYDQFEKIFNDYIKAIMGYSFVSFILDHDNNLKRLKSCPYCNNFFIAKDIKRTYCYSTECKRQHWRKTKAKQREDEPAKYL